MDRGIRRVVRLAYYHRMRIRSFVAMRKMAVQLASFLADTRLSVAGLLCLLLKYFRKPIPPRV